jgi:iron complex outermembrane receptor protein
VSSLPSLIGVIVSIQLPGSASPWRAACASVFAVSAIAAVPATPAHSQNSVGNIPFEEVVVTAPRMRAPLIIVTDPRQPRQPLPAHDGADYLKAIPGFSVIRKGGTDGDPVFRGMAASRVNISVDGQQVLGGCGMRMDPPTAYVFPEAFDRIVVIKGPQTVLEGPGNSAAAVRFERSPPRFERNDVDGNASALAGSFGRSDLVGDLRFGTPRAYADITGTRAESDDYDDGNGERVHSRYLRWSTNAAAGWTPDDASRVEMSGALSDGEAAYADRAMDGVKFARENVALRLERDVAWGVATAVDAQAYYNYVDHVMDNYSLRDFAPTPAMPFRSVSNPDRETTGAKLLAQLQFGQTVSAAAGIDLQRNEHTLRATMNETLQPYEAMPRAADGRFRSAGVFGEGTWTVAADTRVVGGVRVDDWQARDQRETLRLGAMGSVPNPTAGQERNDTLTSGFARYERDLPSAKATLYAGLGHVERFPDYWELLAAGKESAQSLSAFDTDPERTTQFDTGIVWTTDRLEFSLSGFFSEVRDFILIESNYPKGTRRVTITRNVDARTWGGEADMAYAVSPSLRMTGTVAYSRGENRTDGLPLAQMPPLESRLGLDWTRGAWSAGALLRLVDEQDRYALNQGNVVGQDLGPTPGFTIVSINAGWRSPDRQVTATAGVDNLLDRAYAEHLSRSGAMVPGYLQTTRVNEPGRTLWLKVAAGFGDKGE